MSFVAPSESPFETRASERFEGGVGGRHGIFHVRRTT
jgi:hypothetical protein